MKDLYKFKFLYKHKNLNKKAEESLTDFIPILHGVKLIQLSMTHEFLKRIFIKKGNFSFS